jgi:exodeoxyribonuclease VII small subunit
VTSPSRKQSSPNQADPDQASTSASAEPAPSDEFAQLSYEQARDALIDVVKRLESGAETLEESLALWERGEALARHCEQWLVGAQARLDAAQKPS